MLRRRDCFRIDRHSRCDDDRELKQSRKLDKTNQHHTKENDLGLLRWAWCWKNLKRADPATKEESIWEAAQKKNVAFERRASQMEARYRRVVEKLGGVKKALETVKQTDVDREMWISYFVLEVK